MSLTVRRTGVAAARIADGAALALVAVTSISPMAWDEDLKADRFATAVERRICDAANPDSGIDEPVDRAQRPSAVTRAWNAAVGGHDVQRQASIVLASPGTDDALRFDSSVRDTCRTTAP